MKMAVAADSPEQLYCHACQQMKPSNDFHNNPTGSYGKASFCKKCAREAANKSSQRPHVREKARAKAYRQAHKEKMNKLAREWYRVNREYALEQAHQFRVAHPEILSMRWQRWAKTENGKERCRIRVRNRRNRRKGASGNFTYTDIEQQYANQKGMCYYCGNKVGKDYHIEHVIPLTRGGSNNPSNLVIACPKCNLQKGNKLPHEWPQGGKLM